MKKIKRNWIYEHDYSNTLQGDALFIATGQFDNGYLAYSMVDLNGDVIQEHDGAFYQTRYNNKLVMVRL